jgi:hypothetical protein
MKAADAVLVATDWIDAIERLAASTDDPGERAALDHELDQAYGALELAAAEAEQDMISAGVQRLLEARHAEYGTISKATERAIVRAHQRKVEGVKRVAELGLSRWLKPRE